jgi:hypothetical protein
MLNASTEQVGILYRIGECNSFSGGGASGVSNSYASSLWVIDFLFDVALGGSTGVNMHRGGDAPSYTRSRTTLAQSSLPVPCTTAYCLFP